MSKLKAGVLAARGEVGQRFFYNLIDHPYFQLNSVYSKRTAGMKLSKATGRSDLPDSISEMRLQNVNDGGWRDDDIIFSALPSKVAGPIEGMIAEEKPVLTTAAPYREEDDTPIMVPGVNEDHVEIIEQQQKNRGWNGFVIPQSNCTVAGFTISLYPIYKKYGDDLEEVIMVSEQAVSGAGYEAVETWRKQREAQGTKLPQALPFNKKLKGPLFEGNVIPYIKDEEEKVKTESLKILGRYDRSKKKIIDASFYLECLCTRVPVLDGHTEAIFLRMRNDIEIEDLKDIWRNYRGEPQKRNLPSAPETPIIVLDEPDRPQPRLDITREDGMAVVIGRVQKSHKDETSAEKLFKKLLMKLNLYHSKNLYKYFVLSHNTKLGAAKGVILTAEYLYSVGVL